MKFGSIDCTVEKSLCKRFNIKGYPSIKFFRDGAIRAYQSGRTYDDLVAFSKSMLGPPIIEVRSESSVQSLWNDPNNHQGSAFLLVGQDDVVYPLFFKLSLQMQGLTRFLHIAKPTKDLIKRFFPDASSKQSPFILYYAPDLSPELFQGPHTLEEMRSFVEQRRLPIVSTLSGENFDDITNGASQMNKKIAFYIFHPDNTSQIESFTNEIRPLAITYRDRLIVTTVDAMKYSRWLAQFIDVNPSSLPTFIVFDTFPDDVHKPTTPGTQSNEQIQTMIVEIMNNKRSSISSVPWYSPQKYLRLLERWLNGFEEWQIIAGVLGVSAVVFGIMFWTCTTSDNHEHAVPQQEPVHTIKTKQRVPVSSDNETDHISDKPAVKQRKPRNN